MTRVERLASRLPDEHAAALIAAPHHVRYLTGFPSGDSFVLVTRTACWFLTDFRLIEMAQKMVQDAECLRCDRLTDTLTDLCKRHGIKQIYTEAAETSLAQMERLRRGVPGVSWETGSMLDDRLSEMRACKDEAEIKAIEAAQAITEDGFLYILPRIGAGVTEREIALDLEYYMRRQGAERIAFDFIVVSGANTSLPHGIPSDKPIARGDFVTMDYGVVVDGYCSDMTRTVAIGNVSDEQRAVYDIVLNAQRAALAVLKAGLPAKAGDAAARDVIAAAGYGDCFGHSTGHGVGLQIHESPNLSPRQSETLLAVGNVVTVEPGIYLPGKFGVRIEDMAVITETGCRDLTHCPKDLLIL